MRKLAVSALAAEPVRSTVAAASALALFPSGSALDSSYEDGDGTSSWNQRAC